VKKIAGKFQPKIKYEEKLNKIC